MNVSEILARFPDAKKSGNGWTAKCPAHDDNSPSLSISKGDDGRTLIKCFAGCTPDVVCAALGLKISDLFAENGHGKKRNGSPTQSNPAFNWQKCVSDFSETDVQKLAAWRGLSIEFVHWLHAQGIVGIFDGLTAFANHGDGGKIISCHVRLANGKWKFEPTGQRTAPLVFGDTKTAGYVLTFESQWDAFAVMDKLGWHAGNDLQDAAIFVTRGAGNGKLICDRMTPDAICFCFTQNDSPAQKWLTEVASNAGCRVLNVTTPTLHKDANEWTLAGASKVDLQAAMKSAKPVQSATVTPKTSPDSNRADIAREYLGEESEPEQAGLPPIVDAADFMATPQPQPRELVCGMLHQGSKLVLGGGSKSFKTWTLLDLALSVAHGLPWFGRETICGRVLYLNFEIQNYAWQKRIAAVANAKGITLKPDAIKLWNLRGHAAGFQTLLPRIAEQTKESDFALIILDPIYKLYGRTDENKAGDVAALLNGIESLAVQTGAAIAFGAHFSKGNQASKEAIDRISGSGVFARDPDSILIFTKHEEQDAFTVESILRNFAPVAPFAVRWNFPLFELADELDPAKLKQAGGRKREHDPRKLLAAIAETTAEKPVSISAWAKAAKVIRQTLSDYLPEMRSKGWIATTGEGSNARQYLTEKGRDFLRERT